MLLSSHEFWMQVALSLEKHTVNIFAFQEGVTPTLRDLATTLIRWVIRLEVPLQDPARWSVLVKSIWP